MTAASVSKNEICSWVERCLENEKVKKREIFLTGSSEKGDGYMGDIAFVTVRGTKDGSEKDLHFVVKHSKKNQHLRDSVPIKRTFENEIFFYKTVFPAFKQFQLERDIQRVLNSIPVCFKTILLDEMEVLILGNIKKLGFELHDRKKAMGMDHLKAIVREYGKLHALSFAMRDQAPVQFDLLAGKCRNIMAEFIINGNLSSAINQAVDKGLEMLEKNNDLELLEKFEKFLEKGAAEMLIDNMNQPQPQSVINHGDCWNNNFMFKYENGDRTSPSNVVILDWQLVSLRSPVADLSYLIYATSSKEVLDNFDELLQEYYRALSEFLNELGSNPEQLFSYSDLKDHWRKYSIYGFLLMPMILRFALCDQDEAPAFEDLQEGEKISDYFAFDITENLLYYQRLRAVVDHYFNYKL